MPNASASRCVCAPGMINRGVDNQGQELCIRPSGPTNQSGSAGGGNTAGTQTVEVEAGRAWFVAHRQFGFRAFPTHMGNGLGQCAINHAGRGSSGRIQLDSLENSNALAGNDLLCEWVMFQGNIDPAWTLSFTPQEADGSCATGNVTRLPPGDSRGPGFLVSFSPAPGSGGCLMYIETVTMTGPASGKWEEAFD